MESAWRRARQTVSVQQMFAAVISSADGES